MNKSVFLLIMAAVATLCISGCASISEDQCLAGNWAERGYKDGAKGTSRGRLVDYADTCAKYAVSPNNSAYLENYEAGLVTYCTFERGFERGKNGSSYNQVCSGPLAQDFAPGYDEGRLVYKIHQEHKRLVKAHNKTFNQLVDVRSRLKNPEITDEEFNRLSKKKRRLANRLQNIRLDVRAHERLHRLRRYDFG